MDEWVKKVDCRHPGLARLSSSIVTPFKKRWRAHGRRWPTGWEVLEVSILSAHVIISKWGERMKNCWLLLMAALLGACGGPDVRETRISDIDFSDPAAIQKVAHELEPRDRQHFNFYVFRRTVAVEMGGTGITRSDGDAPETVGEAVDLAETAKAVVDQRIIGWKELIAKSRSLTKRKNSLLLPDSSLPPEHKVEYESLEKELAAVQVEIEKQR